MTSVTAWTAPSRPLAAAFHVTFRAPGLLSKFWRAKKICLSHDDVGYDGFLDVIIEGLKAFT